jgi:UDP-glucose 4-epimerase
MTWLITGGAGYIGAHVVRAFAAAGIPTVVLDDLSSGHRSFIADDQDFVEGTLLDVPLLDRVFSEYRFAGVVHIAGYKYAGESVSKPVHTYEQNVTATTNLLAAAQRAGVSRVVFSSSAAVYGTPDTDLVTEATATRPESPYGETKLIGEWLLAAQGRATGLRHTSLRYFNVVGSASPDHRDTSPHNLFPLVFTALAEGRVPRINGTDYPTPDGTCVRDYVHVADIAEAHVRAAERLTGEDPIEPVYNLGSGDGVSVRQIMDGVARVTGVDFEPEINPRRAGDPARIVASGELAARDLDWRMRHSLDDMIRSAWEAASSAD